MRLLDFVISDKGTSMVVQWLRLCAPNAGDLGSIPGQGTRSRATTKTWRSQINTFLKKLMIRNYNRYLSKAVIMIRFVL